MSGSSRTASGVFPARSTSISSASVRAWSAGRAHGPGDWAAVITSAQRPESARAARTASSAPMLTPNGTMGNPGRLRASSSVAART
jgi:hypothetical protein